MMSTTWKLLLCMITGCAVIGMLIFVKWMAGNYL